jgi:predicted DNA-binding transcriptional regulator YafY
MNLLAITDIIRLHDLINRKATGSRRELAARFKASVSTMRRHLEDFKQDFNAPVKYDKSRLTYYYDQPFELIILIEVRVNGCREKII